jgi:hypothetical protein
VQAGEAGPHQPRLISLTVDQDTTGFLSPINLVSGLKETDGKLSCGDLDDHVPKRSNPPTNVREPSAGAELPRPRAVCACGLEGGSRTGLPGGGEAPMAGAASQTALRSAMLRPHRQMAGARVSGALMLVLPSRTW